MTLTQSALEAVACDLCGADSTSQAHEMLCVRDRIYGLPGEFSLVRCEKCSLLYLNPRPDRAHIGVYYPDLDYHAFKVTAGLKSRILESRRKSEARLLLVGLPEKSMALEIGCGTGELLNALQKRGARGVGVEPNAAAAQTAMSRYGLTVHVGMLDIVADTALPAGMFDLVIMKYALEHVHNPRAVLSRIVALLKPGGKAVFWLPNGASWELSIFGARWRGLDAPRHLYIFTPTTVREYAKAVGLQVEKIAFSGVPNDWAGSLSVVLADSGLAPTVAKLFGADSLPALAILWPISALAGVAQRAGRMRVTLRKPLS